MKFKLFKIVKIIGQAFVRIGMDSEHRKLGALNPNHTVIMVCDLQEKFAPSILHFDTIVKNADRLVQAGNILEMPVLATEQYPKVLILNSTNYQELFQFSSISRVWVQQFHH